MEALNVSKNLSITEALNMFIIRRHPITVNLSIMDKNVCPFLCSGHFILQEHRLYHALKPELRGFGYFYFFAISLLKQ